MHVGWTHTVRHPTSNTVLHGILKKRFIYLNLLVMFTQPFYIMFASWTKPFMALNRFLRLGLKGSPLNCFTQVSRPQKKKKRFQGFKASRPQVQILISSFIINSVPLFSFLVYVYGIIIIENSFSFINQIIHQLNSNFDLMDLHALTLFSWRPN